MSNELTDRILRLAARPEGVSKSEVMGEERSTVGRAFKRLLANDKLHSVVVSRRMGMVRFFALASAADHYLLHNVAPTMEAKKAKRPAATQYTPPTVVIQRCAGIERLDARPPAPAFFAALPVGKYPFESRFA